MNSTSRILNFAKREVNRGRGISRAIMLMHTLFSLPLAVCAFILESRGAPEAVKVVWIILAVFGARNAANALNRLIDRQIDAENPRTADRDLPTGKVKVRDLLIFTIVCGVLFLLAAAMLNLLCLLLVPVGAVLIGGYSYTKRFTWLCHFWLGITCSAAVMGSFIALSGSFEIRYFPLTIAAALWVTGFDIIYALQDIEHDRTHGIHSVPARFGRTGALIIAGLSHSGTVFFFLLTMLFYPLRIWFILGTGMAALLLITEHIIAWRGNIKRIPLAAYHLNQILSPLFMIFLLLDVYLPGGMYGN